MQRNKNFQHFYSISIRNQWSAENFKILKTKFFFLYEISKSDNLES